MMRVFHYLLFVVLMVAVSGCPMAPIGGGEPVTFTATLSGDHVVPPVQTSATGTGTFTLNAQRTELAYEISASGLSGPVIEANFHKGAPGTNGTDAFDVTGDIVDTNGQITASGVWPLQASDVTALLDGNIYFQIHTEQNPEGELRGQLY